MLVIEYKWLVGQHGSDLVFTDWDGEQETLAAFDENIMTPDVDDDGMPVIRIIGDGRIALHVRIERDSPLARAPRTLKQVFVEEFLRRKVDRHGFGSRLSAMLTGLRPHRPQRACDDLSSNIGFNDE